MRRNRLHDAMMLSFAAAIVAVADHANADTDDQTAHEKFIAVMRSVADEHREFCRALDIPHCLRVMRDAAVKTS